MDPRDRSLAACGGLWRPVPALRAGLLPLKKDGRLQSCRFGGLDAWMLGYVKLGRFNWFYMDLGGFRLISWIPEIQSLSTCGNVERRAAAPKEDGRLQSCRFGGWDAWMPRCQEAWRLEAWILEPCRLVGLLAGSQDWIGLDLNGC